MFDKKILCLGNNDEDTDHRASVLAKDLGTMNHGLIADSNFRPLLTGLYHTTILDLSFGDIVAIAKHFDQVVMFDQPQEQWSNWKPLLSTYKIMLELEQQGISVSFKHNQNVQKFLHFDQLLITNKSFCIYPWIEFIEEGGEMTLCARAQKGVTTADKIVNWKTNPEYTAIRQKMLAGEPLTDYCGTCYYYESQGIESYRQFETKEWIGKLGIASIDDLDNIEHPYYYELRLSNKCNLMCRGCRPEFSHLIDNEFKKFEIKFPQPQTFKYAKTDYIKIDTLTPLSRVYLTGGDPTVIAEVYTFMKQCIKAGRTDFEFTLGINAQHISAKFLELTDHFSNLNFSISLDGFGPVNDYWRWGSDFATIIRNTKLLKSRGHNISINCVPGIYNVTNLHLLYEFLDQELPDTSVYIQLNYIDYQSPFNHPNVELCLESLDRCRQTKIYLSDGKSNKTAIDSLYQHYSSNPSCDLSALRQFFEYNDQLDHARNSRLGDYIPELEAVRSLVDQKIQNHV